MDVASFVVFSVAIDESVDITDVAQLEIFIHGLDANLTVTEEFVQLVPMTGRTKAEDIFGSLVAAFDNVEVDWARAVSVAADGAPSVTGRKHDVVARFKENVYATNGGLDLWTFHCIIHKESLCSKSMKMDHVMEVVVKTVNFIHAKGLNNRQFDNLLNDEDVNHGLPCNADAGWQSQGAVL